MTFVCAPARKPIVLSICRHRNSILQPVCFSFFFCFVLFCLCACVYVCVRPLHLMFNNKRDEHYHVCVPCFPEARGISRQPHVACDASAAHPWGTRHPKKVIRAQDQGSWTILDQGRAAHFHLSRAVALVVEGFGRVCTEPRVAVGCEPRAPHEGASFRHPFSPGRAERILSARRCPLHSELTCLLSGTWHNNAQTAKEQ